MQQVEISIQRKSVSKQQDLCHDNVHKVHVTTV